MSIIKLTDSLKKAVQQTRLEKAFAADRIGSVAIVGPYDEGHMLGVFNVCARHNIVMAPRVTYQLLDFQYGRKFIQSPPVADMVVFSNVQTPEAMHPTLWYEALCQTKAKIVFNVTYAGGGEGLPTRLLARPPFREPIVTSIPHRQFAMDIALLRQ